MTNINHKNVETSRSLRRCDEGAILGGVASGIAKFLNADVLYVRLGFVVLSVLGGGGLALYLAAWVLIPEEGADTSIAQTFLRRTRRHPS